MSSFFSGQNSTQATSVQYLLDMSDTVDISVSGNSNVIVSENAVKYGKLRLMGTLTDNISLVLPLTYGKKWTILNNSSGPYSITATGQTGTGVYIPMGSKMSVEVDVTSSNIIYSHGESKAIEFYVPISLVGNNTTINTAVIQLPSNFHLLRSEFLMKTSLNTGSATLALGTYGAGINIIKDNAVGLAGSIIGLQSSELGADLLSNYNYEIFFPNAEKLWVKKVLNGNITSGSAILYVVGIML